MEDASLMRDARRPRSCKRPPGKAEVEREEEEDKVLGPIEPLPVPASLRALAQAAIEASTPAATLLSLSGGVLRGLAEAGAAPSQAVQGREGERRALILSDTRRQMEEDLVAVV